MGILDSLGSLGSAIKSSLGDLSLTQPELEETDPDTGRKRVVPYKNKAARAIAFAHDAARTTQPQAAIVPDQTIPLPETPDYTQQDALGPLSRDEESTPTPVQKLPGLSVAPSAPSYAPETPSSPPPRMVDTNYFGDTSEATGRPANLGGLSKLGKLLFLGQHMAEGAMVGSGQRGLARGMEAADQFHDQEMRNNVGQLIGEQGLEHGALQNAMLREQVKWMPQQMRLQMQHEAKREQLQDALAEWDLAKAQKAGLTVEDQVGMKDEIAKKHGLDEGSDEYNQFVFGITPYRTKATTETANGVYQLNPETGRYDIYVGPGRVRVSPFQSGNLDLRRQEQYLKIQQDREKAQNDLSKYHFVPGTMGKEGRYEMDKNHRMTMSEYDHQRQQIETNYANAISTFNNSNVQPFKYQLPPSEVSRATDTGVETSTGRKFYLIDNRWYTQNKPGDPLNVYQQP